RYCGWNRGFRASARTSGRRISRRRRGRNQRSAIPRAATWGRRWWRASTIAAASRSRSAGWCLTRRPIPGPRCCWKGARWERPRPSSVLCLAMGGTEEPSGSASCTSEAPSPGRFWKWLEAGRPPSQRSPLHRERRAAAAGAARLGVVELEPRAGAAQHVIDAGAFEIARAHRVHEDGDAALIVNPVVLPRLLLEVEGVLEAAAAAAADRDAQAVRGI